MKALLISCDNIYLTPYLSLYTDKLDQHQVDYTVLYWDKNSNEDIRDPRYIPFRINIKSSKDKVIGYLKFRRMIMKNLKACKYDYDMVICMHSVGDLILSDVLLRKFKKRYIFDVRDYSYEKYALVRAIEKLLVKYSAMNVISSEGYRNFLPEAQYEVAHNLPKADCKPYRQTENRTDHPIRIGYIGLIRFMEQNKKIVDFFKNDPRFRLYFIGTGAEQLAPHCKENGVTNVELIGTFDQQETLRYYADMDIVMNLYGNHTPLLDYALSNKLYYAAMLYKPILVCRDTYMEFVSSQFGFGFTMNLEGEDERDHLYEYIRNLDRNRLANNCDKFMAYAFEQQKQLQEQLEKIITSIINNEENKSEDSPY